MEFEASLGNGNQSREMGDAASRRSEFEGAQRLQHIATQLIGDRGIQGLYEQILDTVLGILDSDFASLQMFYPERGNGGELRLLGHRGFNTEAATRWQCVTRTTRTTCGEALRTGQRVAVADVRKCDFMAGSEDLDGYLDGGIRAGQTTPLISRSGELLGMVSTYWRDPHELSPSELRALDVLARLAADLVERSRGEEALRRSEERFSRVINTMAEGLYTLDKEGSLTFMNPAAEKMFGRTSAELLGKNMHEVVHYKHLDGSPFPATECARLQVLKNGITLQESEDFFIRKDGSVFPVISSSSPIVNGDEIAGAVVVFRDETERRRAETALRESEERFRSMADTAPVMIWVSGPDKLCTFFNKPWLDFTGRTLQEELGDGWVTGVHPADVKRVIATYSSSFDARREFHMDYRLRRADGEYRWIRDNGIPLWREGEFAGFIGSCVDISEQKTTEERLRASEARLLDTQLLTKVGSWERQLDRNEIHWSDGMFPIYGLPNGAPPDLPTLLRYVHPRDLEKFVEANRQARSRDTSVDVEYRIIRPNGQVRYLRAILQRIRNDQGVPARLVGATQDITELVKNRESLRESEDLLKRAERIAQVGHWQWDIKTDVVSWSEGMFTIFGQPRNYTPTYDGFLQTLTPQDRERMDAALENSIRAKKGFSMEYRISRPNGDLRTLAATSEVFVDDGGVPVQVFGTCQDITDSKRAQEEAFASQKLETVGTLAGGIAHDFNNLLGGILAHAELALDEIAGGSDPVHELKKIRDIALRGSEIVRELMIYAGKENPVVALIDVSRVAEEMLEFLKLSVSKRATLETEFAIDLPPVRANAAQIRRIVMNLVTNASDAIGNGGGVIRVTTRRVTLRRDLPAASPEGVAAGEYVELAVSDDGFGMSAETQARVFDPFFTTRPTGHGLGLPVVHGIVRSLLGDIQVESTPGNGTTIRIFLPCADSSAATELGITSGIASLRRPFRAATILVVEDEHPLRQAVAKMLRKAGFSVMEAGDGSAALEAIREPKSTIDVLLLDVTLPGAPSRDVFEEAKRLRPEISLIVTSAYGPDVAAEKLGSLDRFIRKPYRMSDLVELIGQAVS